MKHTLISLEKKPRFETTYPTENLPDLVNKGILRPNDEAYVFGHIDLPLVLANEDPVPVEALMYGGNFRKLRPIERYSNSAQYVSRFLKNEVATIKKEWDKYKNQTKVSQFAK